MEVERRRIRSRRKEVLVGVGLVSEILAHRRSNQSGQLSFQSSQAVVHLTANETLYLH
jgi:hypothetical protein